MSKTINSSKVPLKYLTFTFGEIALTFGEITFTFGETRDSRRFWVFGMFGCGFFAYNWKLPAYSGALLLTVDNFCFFYLQLELCCLQL